MLVARGRTELHRAKLKWAIGMSVRLWCLAVDRSGLALDTRMVPASYGDGEGRHCLYVLLRGRFVHHGVGTIEGPAAFILTMAEIEGARGHRDSTFRSTGNPYVALELRLAASDLARPTETGKTFELDAATLAAARRVADLDGNDDDSYAAASLTLVGHLADAGIVTEGLRKAVNEPDAWPVRRLWQAIKPMIETLAPASSLQEVSTGTGVSLRQIPRVLGDFLSLAVWGVGWRQVTLHGRFKIAILLLSAEDATIDDVARMVGYGSVNAMGRAFRLAGLDAPSIIQQRLRQAALEDAAGS